MPHFYDCHDFLFASTFDALFGDLGNNMAEVRVGRIPVNNANELAGAVTHTMRYAGLPVSGWRALAVTDRMDVNAGNFAADADTIVASTPELAWSRAYLDITSDQPLAIRETLRAAACGAADLIVYAGHGNSTRLGSTIPPILDVNAVQDWTGNTIFLQSTCNSSWFVKSDPSFHSIAMQALTQPQGGIAASIGASTYMTSGPATRFMAEVIKHSGSPNSRWGDALLAAQQWASSQSGGEANWFHDLARTECLLGDPALPVFAAMRGNAGVNSPTENAPHSPQDLSSPEPVKNPAAAAPLNIIKFQGRIDRRFHDRDRAEFVAVLPPMLEADSQMTLEIGGIRCSWEARSGFTTFKNARIQTKRVGKSRLLKVTLHGEELDVLSRTMNGGVLPIQIKLWVSTEAYESNIEANASSTPKSIRFMYKNRGP